MALSFEEISRTPPAPPDWVVPQWLTRGNTGFIMGEPKRCAKSWLVLGMCWDLSEGLPLWTIRDAQPPARPMRCVYFTQEDTRDNIHSRIMAHVTYGRRAPNDRLWVVPKNLQLKLDTMAGRNMIQAELDAVREAAGPIDLVVFDPMRKMHNGNENDSAVIAEMWGVVDRLHQRYQCATVFVHHVKKPPADKTDWDPTDPFNGRGSGDIYGGGDAFMMVLPGPTNNQTWRRVRVHFESKREAPIPPSELKVHFNTGEVRFLGQAVEMPTGGSGV
jgi:RecA-family ATPase